MLLRGQSRWAGMSIHNVRQKIPRSSMSIRTFSSQRVTQLTRPATRIAFSNGQQARNLSLFGWGSSSKSAAESATALSSPNNVNVEIDPKLLEDVRTVRASHATSDAPDPSLAHSQPVQHDPNIIEKVSNAISLPADSPTVSEIIDGQTEIAAVAERIGYLKEVCGLDYGWGPTAFMEWCLEHLHVTGGLGWATSIIILAAGIRLIMVKPMISAQKEGQKMKEIKPIIDPLRAKSNQYLKEGNRQKGLEVAQEMRAIQREYDVKMRRMFIPLLIQLPLGFGAFRLLRGAGSLPVPSFTTESWLWNTDLSFSDPYYITPAISAGLIYWQLKQGQKGADLSANPFGPQALKLLGAIFPVASFGFMIFQPGAVQLYFVTSAAAALATTTIIRNSRIRKYYGLAPVGATFPTGPVTPQVAVPTKPGGMQQRVKEAPVVQQASEEGQNRSLIDKYVDKAKSSMKLDKKQIFKPKSAAEVAREKAEKHEYNRSQQIQIDRETRNRAARERTG